ncbi:SIMPL domain-containing protein [Sphingomonas sp. CFBP8993]|uniref:SIMPL domain-containing protein n=1 Tax=Sphingomonas sp. CFBP8993 TaxID=3096526 RepID=UPI002A6A06DE|nr:SIMPL domain-containing protein [Sphingomonas sp. CFBP8993]MDY0958062.1 SIMPL domain-containing protein [Sphingomonas sp. CFBP8993]
MRKLSLAVLAGLSTTGALAQTAQPPRQILVSALGTARTPPDRVTVGYMVRGEGATSDEATAKLRDQAKAIRSEVEGLLRGAVEFRASQFDIAPVRSRECNANSYGPPQLSTGPCAILGYVATMPVAVVTSRVADAGTLVGLIGRLGGLQASIARYWLSNDDAARQQAMRAALTNAKAQATLIAEGSGSRLGALLRVQDSNYREVTIEMTSVDASTGYPPPPPAPAAPPAPIRIDMAPQPIETNVRLMAAYAIEP